NSDVTPLWSVSLEEQFYLFWPVCMAIFGARAIPGLCGVFLLCSVLTRLALMRADARYFAFACHPLARLDALAWGALLAWLSFHGRMVLERGIRFVVASAAIAVPLWCMYQWKETAYWGWHAMVTYACAGLSSAALVAALLSTPRAAKPRGIVSRVLEYL